MGWLKKTWNAIKGGFSTIWNGIKWVLGRLIRIPRWGLLEYLASASGAPLPPNYKVAIPADQSVHVSQPEAREADDGER